MSIISAGWKNALRPVVKCTLRHHLDELGPWTAYGTDKRWTTCLCACHWPMCLSLAHVLVDPTVIFGCCALSSGVPAPRPAGDSDGGMQYPAGCGGGRSAFCRMIFVLGIKTWAVGTVALLLRFQPAVRMRVRLERQEGLRCGRGYHV